MKKSQSQNQNQYVKPTMIYKEAISKNCIIYYNSGRILENYPFTEEMLSANIKPFACEVWNYGRNRNNANLIDVSAEQVIMTLLPRCIGKFARNGLKVNGLRYKHPNYTEMYLKGGEVTVAYNPDSVSDVWLIDNGEYVKFELIESRYEHMNVANVASINDVTAINTNMKQEDMPKNILIISDMEFDQATYSYGWGGSTSTVNETLFKTIGRKFEKAGYQLPRLVFWNVNSRTGTIPVKENALGVALVSGFSINVAKMVLSGELDPYKCLIEQLDTERYAPIRVDGNAFHTFTRGFERPFDSIMAESMQRTMKYMCENISGCVLGYTQSDEITLLLIDYKKKNQGAWFGYVKRKVETIAASMATMAFNEAFSDVITEKISEDIMKVQNDEEAEKVKD